MLKDVTVISGYFLAQLRKHPGYRQMIQSAYSLGNPVIAIVNNEQDQTHKYGRVVRDPDNIRRSLLQSPYIDYAIKNFPNEDHSVCRTLETIRDNISGTLTFYKDGGEYNLDNLPEAKVEGIKIVFGTNPKIASSSEILGITKNE